MKNTMRAMRQIRRAILYPDVLAQYPDADKDVLAKLSTKDCFLEWRRSDNPPALIAPGPQNQCWIPILGAPVEVTEDELTTDEMPVQLGETGFRGCIVFKGDQRPSMEYQRKRNTTVTFTTTNSRILVATIITGGRETLVLAAKKLVEDFRSKLSPYGQLHMPRVDISARTTGVMNKDRWRAHCSLLAEECQKLVNEDRTRVFVHGMDCLLYTSPSPRDLSTSRMPSSA